MNVATFGFYIASAHRLGVEPGGTFLALVAAVTLPATVISVFATTLMPAAARWVALGDAARVTGLVRAAAPWYAGLGAATLVAAVAARVPVAAFFHTADTVAVLAAALALVAQSGLLLARALLQAVGWVETYGVSQLVEAAAKALAIGALLAFAPSVRVAMLGFTFAACVTTAYALGVLVRFTARYPARPGGTRAAFAGTAATMVVFALSTVVTLYDPVVAKHYLDPYQAGLYNAAALVGRALISFLAVVSSLLLPAVAARNAVGASSARLFGLALGGTAAVALAAVAFCALAPGLVVGIVAGGAFREAAPLVAPYALGSGALALFGLVLMHEVGCGRVPLVATTAVTVAEVGTAVLYHPSAATLVAIVACGHAALFGVLGVGALRAANERRRWSEGTSASS